MRLPLRVLGYALSRSAFRAVHYRCLFSCWFLWLNFAIANAAHAETDFYVEHKIQNLLTG
jgi:hypothetical protein